MFTYAQFLVQERVYNHARHIIYTCIKIISNEIYLMCDVLCDDCLPRSFCYFFFFNFFLNFHFSLKLFLICSYFLGDLSLTVLIKCVLNKEKKCMTVVARELAEIRKTTREKKGKVDKKFLKSEK